jgi:membrane-associated HD superfamily phosphohydrolase
MSTLVITAHVKEGLSLALVHKLPDVIRNALAQHHGTSLVSFFHHKAQSQMQEEADAASPAPASNGKPTVDEAGFRYPGPKPASREAAILCLADAVEAASRSVSKPTPAHIEDMVGDIVNARVTDGQLDESDLTLADLVRVKRSFVFTLTNMLHGRVQYPIGEDRGKQQAKPAPGERPGGREDDPVPDEPGLSS